MIPTPVGQVQRMRLVAALLAGRELLSLVLLDSGALPSVPPSLQKADTGLNF
jgi:hypothetical protein